jgi:TIR domain
MNRDLLFISHVNPKNNYQAAWLEAKLTLLGYRVWVDVKDLTGGDSFWPEIQQNIQNNAAIFIPIVTKDYIDRAITPRSGVRKEISCADNIKQIKNFIVPLRFDNSEYSNFPIEFQEMIGFDFSENWSHGLEKLVLFLEKNEIPKAGMESTYLNKWFEALRINSVVVQKEEKYYTNWMPITLPTDIFVHEPENINDQELLKIGFPHIVESRYIITFVGSEINKSIKLNRSLAFTTESFCANEDADLGRNLLIVDTKKKLIKLLNLLLSDHLKSQNLGIYSQSSNREIFFHKKNDEQKKKISLKKYGRSTKALNGRKADTDWYYAVSFNAKLFPIPHYKISHHLYFEKDGTALDKDGQHEYRRSTASGWYNKDWLDMLLAFFLKLNNAEENVICIPVSPKRNVFINCEPHALLSDYGYQEPNSIDIPDEERSPIEELTPMPKTKLDGE